jgi:NADP-dependent 3-hydroxy acid dehydrogenase YdfG
VTKPAVFTSEISPLDSMLDVNIKGCFFIAKEAAKIMQKQA